MKTLPLKLISALLLIYIMPFDLVAKIANIEKSRSIKKTLQLTPDQKVDIENKFGDVKITTWDKNELVVNITITVSAKNEDKAESRMEDISVDIKEGKSEVYFKTKIRSRHNNGNELQINYDVKMPKSNELKLKNSFGAFAINDLEAKADIEVKFGSASIGGLHHSENELAFDFCEPINIEEVMGGNITLKYSKMNLTSANNLTIFSEFSSSEINSVSDLSLTLKFGSIKIDEITNVDITSNMASIEIGVLKEKADIKPKYGSLDIEHLSKEFTLLDIDGEFSPINVTIEESTSLTIDIYASMAKVKVPKKDWRKIIEDSDSILYQGTFGNAPNSKLNVRSSFGKVKLDF